MPSRAEQIRKDIDAICSIYPTVGAAMFDEVRERLALRIADEAAAKGVEGHPDTKRLNAIKENYYGLVPFDMPTGAGDFDVGWRVLEYHVSKPFVRTVVEAFRDDPREAIDAAIASKAKGTA